jgi:inhibitor of KinA
MIARRQAQPAKDEFRILPAGDTALVVEFGDAIERGVSARVLALARALEEAALAGVVETVPTFRSLMVVYEPLVVASEALAARIADLAALVKAKPQPCRRWRLPACYDESLAPDLADVSRRTGLSPAQIVERHSAPIYHVYMLGFLPGQAYLGDLADALVLPRRQVPRTRIPAGSLAMAMAMTCIFPMETPCGWHIIGRSPVPLWKPQGGALVAPGDQVVFEPVTLREFEALAGLAAEGRLSVAPVAEAMEAAA